MCVSDGRMRQNETSLSGGHVTLDEQTPNLALNHPSHTPGSYTGDKHQNAQKRRQLNTSSCSVVLVNCFRSQVQGSILLFQTD